MRITQYPKGDHVRLTAEESRRLRSQLTAAEPFGTRSLRYGDRTLTITVEPESGGESIPAHEPVGLASWEENR